MEEYCLNMKCLLLPVPAALPVSVPPLPLSSPPSFPLPPPPPLLVPRLPPPLPGVAAAGPPGGVFVIAVQVAALVLPLPAGFFSVVSVVAIAGGERGSWRRL